MEIGSLRKVGNAKGQKAQSSDLVYGVEKKQVLEDLAARPKGWQQAQLGWAEESAEGERVGSCGRGRD